MALAKRAYMRCGPALRSRGYRFGRAANGPGEQPRDYTRASIEIK
jgi:hypothetical protein